MHMKVLKFYLMLFLFSHINSFLVWFWSVYVSQLSILINQFSLMILTLNFLCKVTLTKILILILIVFFIFIWINFDSVLFGFWMSLYGFWTNFTVYFRNDNRRMSHLRNNLRFHLINTLLLTFCMNNNCWRFGFKTNEIFSFRFSFSLGFLNLFV